MRKESDLSKEDLERVQEYLNSGFNQTERGPYRPLTLLLVLWIVVTLMGGVAWLMARLYGFV